MPITNNLKTNDSFNKTFNGSLSSDDLNAYLNSANLVTNNLIDILKDYYNGSISIIDTSTSDNDMQTFLSESITNFVLQTLSNIGYLNKIETFIYNVDESIETDPGSNLIFKLSKFKFINNTGSYDNYTKQLLAREKNISTPDNSCTFEFQKKEYDRETYSVIKHRSINASGNIGQSSNVSGWNQTINNPCIYSTNKNGHVGYTNIPGNYTIKTPSPIKMHLIKEETLSSQQSLILLSTFQINDYKELEVVINTDFPHDRYNYLNENIDIDLLLYKGKRMICLKQTSSSNYGLVFEKVTNNTIILTNTFDYDVSFKIYGVIR